MATLWDVVTDNSNLPTQAGNTFWDHLNNQKTGSGTTIIGGGKTLKASATKKITKSYSKSLNRPTQKKTISFDKSRSIAAKGIKRLSK